MVLTFEELAAIFDAAELNLPNIGEEAAIQDASAEGRGFPKVGGQLTLLLRKLPTTNKPIISVKQVHF
jgi:iron only hydrogenase large subunit-like protein